MRSSRVHKVAGLVVAAAVFVLASCTTTNMTTNRTGWSDYAAITIKDYSIVGSVRVTSEEVKQRGFLGFVNSHEGGQITYDMLIEEAKALGADDIINVRIDRTDESVHHGLFDFLIGYTEKYTYVGNALAIKLTDAQPDFRADGATGDSGMDGQSPAAISILDLVGASGL